MDVSRAEKIADVLKATTQLGKNIKKPSTIIKSPVLLNKPVGEARLPPAVEGSGVLRVLMYVVAGLLLIGLILLGVDQWITPIFQRVPGGSGYIPIPGTDMSQVYWTKPSQVANITIGTPPPSTTGLAAPLFTTVLEDQSNYSITMDVFISDEYPQISITNDRRVFFMIGQTPTTPSIIAWISNSKNTAYITCFNSNGLEESTEIQNVPIHKPFRIGIVKSPFIMEAYFNGLLVMTRQLRAISKTLSTGDTIFSPANITVNGITLSQKIKVLNIRTFGYTVSPSEMLGRMNDLTDISVFNPPK
jgi:hypothetical protein